MDNDTYHIFLMKGLTSKLTNRFQYLINKWGINKQSMLKNENGEWLLFSQIIILLMNFLPSLLTINTLPIQSTKYFGVLIFIYGLIYSLKSLKDLGSNLSPLPKPILNSILVQDKSYNNFRHPLYRSLIFISLGITIFKRSIFHLILLIILALVLKKKAMKEESYLIKLYPEYKDYMKNVTAIIKFIPLLNWNVTDERLLKVTGVRDRF